MYKFQHQPAFKICYKAIAEKKAYFPISGVKLLVILATTHLLWFYYLIN